MGYLNQKSTASDCAYIYSEDADGAIVRVAKSDMKDALGVTAIEDGQTDADILAMLDGTRGGVQQGHVPVLHPPWGHLRRRGDPDRPVR